MTMSSAVKDKPRSGRRQLYRDDERFSVGVLAGRKYANQFNVSFGDKRC